MNRDFEARLRRKTIFPCRICGESVDTEKDPHLYQMATRTHAAYYEHHECAKIRYDSHREWEIQAAIKEQEHAGREL